MDHTGYNDAADYLVRQYDNGYISNSERSVDIDKVLKYHGAKDMEELRLKRRGY